MLPIAISLFAAYAVWRIWRCARRSLQATPKRNDDFIFF